MIHPHTEIRFINDEVGYGVFATRLIPAGTVTWVQDELDREFSPGEVARLSQLYQEILDTYTFRNNKGNFVLCWDNARFVNHSFNSNCLTTAYDFELAIREILPGEQVTDDYGYLNISEPFRAVDEGTRRKIVYPDDLLRYAHLWDKKLTKVFNKISTVEQPLGELIDESLWDEIRSISSGKKKMESIATNYFQKK